MAASIPNYANAIQIQPMLRLNTDWRRWEEFHIQNSNTTNVKVKLLLTMKRERLTFQNSNTTNVKVKRVLMQHLFGAFSYSNTTNVKVKRAYT